MKKENFSSVDVHSYEHKEKEPKIEKLFINDFAKSIGLEPNKQGRFTFAPEHDQLAYEYAEKFIEEKKAEGILIDGVASPAVIASLLHGAHPAEGFITYMSRDKEGNMSKEKTQILEPIPEGEGSGPEGFTWSKTETDSYTLVEFALGGNFDVNDLDKVIPPEVNPSKPVLISGRGPLYLTHTIASAYRHYKGVPAVGFYQPASKFGPAKTEIGISHDEEYPLGLNFGEPSEINSAKRKYEKRISTNLNIMKDAIEEGDVDFVEVEGKKMKINLDNGESYIISVKDIRKE